MSNTQKKITDLPRQTIDARSKAAYDIFEKNQKGNLLIHKTTRAGATVSLVSESFNRFEKVVCLVPTNNIAAKTIVTKAKKFCNVDNVDIVRVLSNHHCLHNVELFKEYPDLKELTFLPLAENCEGCKNFEKCPVTKIFRRPEAEGIVLTYHKLAALLIASMTRENSTAEQVLESLKNADNLLLDEVHEMQYGRQESLKVYDGRLGETWNLTRYENLPEKPFKWIKEIIKRMQVLKEDEKIKVVIHEIKGGAEDKDFWKKHLRKTIFSPCLEFSNQSQNEAITIGALKEIIELTKVRTDYDLSIEDILKIYKMMAIVTGNVLTVSAIRERGVIKINLSCTDSTLQKMIYSFVMNMQNKAKRILLTSATICSFDYGKLFMGGIKPKNIIFGEGGDPLNTNEKMLICADNKKYNAIGDRSRYKKRAEILSRILEILEFCEGREVMIVTLSKKEAIVLEEGLRNAGKEHEVHYYKSPDMMGVTATARIMIAVGIAYKSANSFDSITNSEENSKKLLYEAIHADTWQALSRVKDPEGIQESIVFGLGCCVDDLKACIEWGFNREIVGIEENKTGCRNKVEVRTTEGKISKPKLIHCKNVEEMLSHAENHFQLPKKLPVKSRNRLYNIIDGCCKSDRKVYKVNTDFLEIFINRRDLFKLYNPDTERYFDVKKPISEKDIKDHLSGNVTIGGYQIDNKTNLVKWLCFDIDAHHKPEDTKEQVKACVDLAEKQKADMEAFLTNLKIPYTLEESGRKHSYHFWIFLKPVDASAAYDFGRDIVKELGYKINTKDGIEVFPKQKSINPDEFGNFVKLPLGIKSGLKSRIYQDGKPVRKVSDIEIGFIDITGYTEFVSEKQKEAKKARKTADPVKFNTVQIGTHRVRECLVKASKMVLDGKGEAGNITRVFIARELINAGLQPEEIAEYFKDQPDYDRKKTLYHIGQVMKKVIPSVPCHTIYETVGNFIGCEQCSNFLRCEIV